ncbi:MAG: hypothetical protein WA461_09475 [Nitrososphaeraceae archaeon]
MFTERREVADSTKAILNGVSRNKNKPKKTSFRIQQIVNEIDMRWIIRIEINSIEYERARARIVGGR